MHKVSSERVAEPQAPPELPRPAECDAEGHDGSTLVLGDVWQKARSMHDGHRGQVTIREAQQAGKDQWEGIRPAYHTLKAFASLACWRQPVQQ